MRFCRAAVACLHRRICWRIDDLASARQRPRRVRLNAGFTTSGGDRLNAPPFFAETAPGWPRLPRRCRFCPNKKQGRVERDESRHRNLSEFARLSALAPFRTRNYRFQWPADLLTSWAFEMETLILGWYVLVETGSVLLLTVFASLNFIGILIAPMFGVVGDRIGHRDLLAMMRATYAVLAATLMTLALTGHLTPLYVFVIVTLMGVVRPSDLGVRGALVANIMPHDQLIGAISISRTTIDTARFAGALSGAALFAALGMGPAYVAIVSLYVVSTLLTLCVVAPSRPHPVDELAGDALRRSPIRDLKEGVAYV